MLEAIQNVVSGILFDNKFDKDLFINRVYKFVQNDPIEAECILKIVSKLKWIRSKEINEYFCSYFNKKYSVGNVLIDFKEKAESSSTGLIATISREGLCNDNQIIKKSQIKSNPSIIDDYENVYFIDDYIGSGSTIIENIDDISEFLKEKNVYIVSYAIQEQGYSKIKIYNKNINIKYKLILNSYREEYDQREINYINKICEECPDKDYAFGYNDAGAYIVINKQTPNSDISLLWYPGIKIENKRWVNLFDREISYEILAKKNNEMINKNELYLLEEYPKIKSRYNLKRSEFLFLIYTYACYYSRDSLIKSGYFETIEEMNCFLKQLIEKQYIEEKKGCIVICNPLYSDIKEIMDSMYKNNNKYKKQKSTEFVGSNEVLTTDII